VVVLLNVNGRMNVVLGLKVLPLLPLLGLVEELPPGELLLGLLKENPDGVDIEPPVMVALKSVG
jgi:hypothetical protein